MNAPSLKKLRAALAGAALLAATACGAPAPAADNAASPAAGGNGYPMTIDHAMGSTEIPSQPERVVVLDSSYIDAALLLEADIVGYAHHDPKNPFGSYLGDVSDETRDAVSVGTLAEPNLEKILELDPDLIVSAKMRHEALYPQLSKIAPTVFSESTGATWKENVVFLGEALGKKELAEDLVAGYEARAKAVGEEILAKEPDTTYSLVRFFAGDTARLYSSNSFIGHIMTDMGLSRPENQPDTTEEVFLPLSPEQIPSADASLIMVSAYTPEGAEGDAAKAQQESFQSNPLWKRLTGDVLSVDDTTFLTSVSIQGAHAVITELASHYDVDPLVP
ncbi:ABC transporter substrate-binding protein [Arthrobacter mobilis]|uniref:Iron-siderophore ABC transporter substrate-binding protein n=1 Tax=Arthrobacter mobilis TaxID=2724944 RepID=A0A7X6K5D0_9MICC|nr:iron-siderophore ABC transporter substrate-binding protein [Arthrobacter mobilis]NKX56317.1 iron-siderophore ABC transporter substrate-binding protein [Arthrobacter mobilis]